MKILYLFVLIIIASSCGEHKDKPVSKKKSLLETLQKERASQKEKPEGSCLVLVEKVEVIFLNSSKVNSAISGTVELIAGEGTIFKKGDLLVQLDNRAAFDELVSQKENFILEVKKFSAKNSLNDTRWSQFEVELNAYKLLPELPQIDNPGNDENKLISDYESINRLEKQMRNHFVIAQNNGTVLTQNYKVGQKVKNGATLLLTGKSKQKAFRLPENHIQNGNAILENEKTGKKYPVKITQGKTWIKVETHVPIGKQVLQTQLNN